jgi:hypothetical protein
MADKSVTSDAKPDATVTPPASSADAAAPSPTPPPPPKRSPGHRGADVKDTVAEMTAKAHEISLEAGSKMAGAMKDVINAAAGITGFVLESARDLVQYMVRRGQMTQEEADKLIRQAEDAQVGRPAPAPKAAHAAEPAVAAPAAVPSATVAAPAPPAPPAAAPAAAPKPAAKTAAKKAPAEKPAAEKAPAAKGASAKPAMAKKTIAPAKKAAPAARKAPAKPAAKKAPAKRR